MRKITQDAIRAFSNGNKFKRGNTEVRVYPHSNYRELRLHNNVIAWYDENYELNISNCGYFTTTTKERLNGLSRVSIYQKDWEWFLNGNKWDGSRVNMTEWDNKHQAPMSNYELNHG